MTGCSKYRKTVARINAMEPEYEKLSDEALRGKTQEFKERIAQGETLDALLPRPSPWCAGSSAS